VGDLALQQVCSFEVRFIEPCKADPCHFERVGFRGASSAHVQTVARIVDMSELTPNQKRCCVELVKGRTGIQTAGSRCFQVIRRP